jgi:ferredoxin
VCKKGALSFGRAVSAPRAAQEDKGRRAFINSAALLVAGAAGSGIARAQNMKVDGGLADVEPKQPLEREPRLVPPGAGSVKSFYDRCTACQLCIAACPNAVLRPSTDPDHLLQPQMGYENGFCRPECTACSQVCPAGAIRPVDKDQKTLIRIGTAVVNPYLCFAASGKEACGACERHCPTGAISMVHVDGVRRPVVAEEQCIGCGKCERECSFGAITVEKNLAYIDFEKCRLCRKCEKVCPKHAIIAVNFPAPKPAAITPSGSPSGENVEPDKKKEETV